MRIVLTILLILLALVVLILLLRVGGKVEFSELGLRAWIRLGPVYYQLYPRRPLPKLIQWLKNRRNRKKKAKSPPKAPERASGTRHGASGGKAAEAGRESAENRAGGFENRAGHGW